MNFRSYMSRILRVKCKIIWLNQLCSYVKDDFIFIYFFPQINENCFFHLMWHFQLQLRIFKLSIFPFTLYFNLFCFCTYTFVTHFAM